MLKHGQVMKRINLWANPRSASTSTMYAFAQRKDTIVFDEPLYPSYLNYFPELERPYRENMLKLAKDNGSIDGNYVIKNILLGGDSKSTSKPIRFYKNILSQIVPNIKLDFLPKCDHLFLVRHPFRVFSSYYKTHGSCTMYDSGFPNLAILQDKLESLGYNAPVLHNDDLLSNPEEALKTICERFGIEFDPKMLHWEKNGIPEDGIWAKYWYKGTHNSTGFLREGADSSTDEDEESLLEKLPKDVQHEARLAVPLYNDILKKNSA